MAAPLWRNHRCSPDSLCSAEAGRVSIGCTERGTAFILGLLRALRHCRGTTEAVWAGQKELPGTTSQSSHRLHSGCPLGPLCLLRGLLQAAGKQHQQEAWASAWTLAVLSNAVRASKQPLQVWTQHNMHGVEDACTLAVSLPHTAAASDALTASMLSLPMSIHRPGAACLVMPQAP